MPYLLDTNVFIESKNRHYGFDFCPAFWTWIDEEHAKGTVFSVEKVYEEIQQGADELADWTRARKSSFIQPDGAVLARIQIASQWTTTQGYRPDAVATFLASADLYLIAHAHALGFTVVTHELQDQSKRRVKIPNVCIALGIEYKTPFQMLRAEKARFVLAAQ